MKVSVSRPAETSRSDAEWPGPDSRRWLQCTLDGRLFAVQAPAHSPPREEARNTSNSTKPPELERGQTRLPLVNNGRRRLL